MCKRNSLRLLGRPGPSSTAEGYLEREDNVEIEEGDRTGSTTEDSWSMCGDSIYRHHNELLLQFYDQNNETFPIPLKDVDVVRQTHTSISKVSEYMINGPKRRVPIFLRSGLGLQDSRSYVQDFLKDTSGKMEDLRRSKRTTRPDSIWPEAGTRFSKKQKEKQLQTGQK